MVKHMEKFILKYAHLKLVAVIDGDKVPQVLEAIAVLSGKLKVFQAKGDDAVQLWPKGDKHKSHSGSHSGSHKSSGSGSHKSSGSK